MGFRPGSALAEPQFQAVCCQSEDGMIKQHLHSNQVISSPEDVADHPEREYRVTPYGRHNASMFEPKVGVAKQSVTLNDRPPSTILVEFFHRLPPPSAMKETMAPLLLSPAFIPTFGLERPVPTSVESSHLVLQRGHTITPSLSVASSPPSPAPPSQAMSNREHFLILIKILFKCLDQANEPEVRSKAKQIVTECTRRNRQGDSKFTPLIEAVEKRLRGVVGEVHWRRARLLLRYYVNKRNNSTINLSPDAISSSA